MSTTWIRVAAAAVSTVAIIASAPMIASATEGRHSSSNDISVTVKSDDSERSHESGDDQHYTAAKNPTISVGIPAIAFTKDIVSVGDQLRTPVLINAAERAGVATLVRDGAPTSCSVQAQPGVVAWLQCSLNSSDRRGGDDSSSKDSQTVKKSDARGATHVYTVVVRMADGQTASHAITVN